LQRLAPHLVRPVPFVYPLTHRGWERLHVGAGLTLYDALASVSSTASGVPRRKHLTKRQALRLVPSLRKDALVGAVEYYDAQVVDARHTMILVRTAVAYGALAANRSRVTGFIRQGERVTGVRVRDLETGQELEIRAKQVLNATGVWTDETQSMVGERGQFGSGPARASTWSCRAIGSGPRAA
jgi:glycerol-3-phosphate dehydrogenase